jgi:hypothetical protein
MSEIKKTEFKGAVSLEAILAAKSAESKDKPRIEDTIKQPIKKEEEKVNPPVVPESEEEEIETSKVPEVTAPEKPVITSESTAHKTAKRLIELGILEDFSIQTSEEDEEGTPISEFINMTEEDLEEIVKMHNQEKQEEQKKNFLPKGNLKEHHLKVIEILENGGDLSQIAETPEKAMERPFEGFDMDVQERQIDVVYTDLVHSKKLSPDKAIALIKLSVEKGNIQEEAQDIFDMYRGAHEKYIDEILNNQKKDREFKELNSKENKKSLTEKLKSAGLKESVYKKVATEYSRRNESGEYTLVDKLREALSNPEENHELILHLADKDMFNELFKIKSSQEEVKKIYKLARQTQSQGNRKVNKTVNEDNTAPWLKYAQAHNDKLNQK